LWECLYSIVPKRENLTPKTGGIMLKISSLLLFLPLIVFASKSGIDHKVDSLMALMTIDEKIGQMNQYSDFFPDATLDSTTGKVITGPISETNNQKRRMEELKQGKVGSILGAVSARKTKVIQQYVMDNTRLKIPLIFGLDVIHGYRTIFPVPLGESASWDLPLIERAAQIAAEEASASGIHWTFAPMVDICRDARWGRIMEGAGEDPYLGSQIAMAKVKGFQGKSLSDANAIAACAKHFAGYGFAEAGRDYNTVDISDNTLRNMILPPFKACVDAGVATFMNSFNEIGGTPSTSSVRLVREILKKEWGFKGFAVSDWGSIGEMLNHGVVQNKTEASLIALRAGCDMDMESECYVPELSGLIKKGLVDTSLINDAVRRILTLKYKLGLFENPFRSCSEESEKKVLFCEANRAAARDLARRSIVLLKNEKNLLPLKKSSMTIAVIGPIANDKDIPLGNWRGQAVYNSAVSLLEGIKAAVPQGVSITYAPGCKFTTGERGFLLDLKVNSTDTAGFGEAVAIAKKADLVIMGMGEDCYMTGEARSRANIGLPGMQLDLLKRINGVNKNIVLVLFNGRPLTLTWEAENIPAIVETWFAGSESGHAIADILFGKYNPSGKITASFPYSVGQCPIYYNHKNTGRPDKSDGNIMTSRYIDVSTEPLFPFGFGLSYTTFKYSNLKLDRTKIDAKTPLAISITVTNTGKIEGEEVAQLYIQDLVGTMTRPVKELKRFLKINLKPGESKTVTFQITAEDLKFFDYAGKFVAEPGAFKIFVGANSKDLAEALFQLL
jgi:beta-glucosidase